MLITNRKPGIDKQRAKQTIDFCSFTPLCVVLDIGEPNDLASDMSKAKHIFVVNTTSDLDYYVSYDGVYSDFKYITCFEVIEHIMNPRLFLDRLYAISAHDVVLYLSYPSRPKFLWNNDEHFHEYDSLRFNHLLNVTGWKIVDSKKIYVRTKITGIRPIIRNLLPQTVVYKIVKRVV